jgi:CHASE3 domain sensor protein
MATSSLDRVLTEAEALPQDEQQMLEELLRGRRIEAWRRTTAAEGKKAIRAFRAGKLKAEPVDAVIARLWAGS